MTANVWLVDGFFSGFAEPTAEWRLWLFRVLLGAALVIKFIQAPTHGGWNRLQVGSFGEFQLRQKHPRLALWVRWSYRPVLIARIPVAMAFTAGVLPRLLAPILIALLLFDLLYEYRRNVLFLACCLAVIPFGGAVDGATPPDGMSDANTFASALLVLLTVQVYWNSAILKLRSQQFTSGGLLAQHFAFRVWVRDRTPYREFFFPRWLVASLGDRHAHRTRWRALSLIAVIVELALPLLLAFPDTFMVGVGIGIGLHLAFTLLLPFRLVPFGLATCATYLAFQP